jgi:hypothetical protein
MGTGWYFFVRPLPTRWLTILIWVSQFRATSKKLTSSTNKPMILLITSKWCPTKLYDTILYDTVRCYTMLCYAIPRYPILYISYYTITFYTIRSYPILYSYISILYILLLYCTLNENNAEVAIFFGDARLRIVLSARRLDIPSAAPRSAHCPALLFTTLLGVNDRWSQ